METNTENNEVPIEPSVAPVSEPITGLPRKHFQWNLVIAPALLIGGMLIGYMGRPLMTPAQSASSSNAAPILQLLIYKTRHWQGNANAPVTMLEFSDFQ